MIVDILGVWVRGLLSLILIGLGIGLVAGWYNDLPSERVIVDERDPLRAVELRRLTPSERVAAWEPGWNRPTALLASGLGLLVFSFGGGWVINPRLWRPAGDDEPRAARDGELRHVQRPDGTVLNVEIYGQADAPPLVLTHGWGADSTEWYYLKRRLAGRYRLLVWDLPGSGHSTEPVNRDYSLEKMARDLEAVLSLAGNRPAVLIGHSIGGMTMLTFCRLFPQALGTRVAGLVLTHTTYTNPLHTISWAPLYKALQKPIIEPLLHVTIALSPLVRVMNWLSYLNGTAHWNNHFSSFAGTETRGQLDFVARYNVKFPPSVLARGVFGMLRYDATDVLPTIAAPCLVIPADRDTTTRPEASEYMRSEIPASRLAALSPAKHMGLIERNDEYVRLVDEFCASVLGLTMPAAGERTTTSAVTRT